MEPVRFWIRRNYGFAEKLKQEEDYNNLKNDVLKEVKNNFRPEFLNRIDEIIVFQKLNTDEMKKITKILLNGVAKRLEKKNIKLNFEKSVEDLIINSLEDEGYGARPIRRLIQNLVEDKIVDEYLNGKLYENMDITVFSENNALYFR